MHDVRGGIRDAAVGRRMCKPNGVSCFVLDDAREVQRLRVGRGKRREVGGVLQDHEPARQPIELDPVDDPASADVTAAATDRKRRSGQLAVRILERDDAGPVSEAGPVTSRVGL